MDELFNFPSRFYYIFLRNWLNNDTGWQFWKLDVGNPGKKMQSKSIYMAVSLLSKVCRSYDFHDLMPDQEQHSSPDPAKTNVDHVPKSTILEAAKVFIFKID